MPGAASLLAAFREASGATTPIEPELATQLLRVVAAARAAYPDFELNDEGFAQYLGERIMGPTACADLAAIHAEDLYLAWACGLRDPAALKEFDRLFFGATLERALARITTAHTTIEEVRQLVRVKLFVSDDERPKIFDYSGRGPLGGWVRVAAVRTALNLATRQPPDAPGNASEEPLLGVSDPETDYLKSQHRTEFEQSFRLAMATLSMEQRQLLRLHYVDTLTLAQIGRLRRTHESTVSRHLMAARDQLLAETRRGLRARLALPEAEVDSLLGQMVSRANVTLTALFRSV
jgi:RNA polymerase sigma-70 factor (ECF subfamily)